MRAKIKKCYFALLFVLGFVAITILPIDVKAGSSPYDVSSSVRSGWDSVYGGKMFNEYSGKMLIYDIYSSKIISTGYNVQNKNFGNGTQPYVAFSGWAVLFGHKDHTSTNNDTYIVAKKVSGTSGIGTEKVYGTVTRGLSATEDLEYNNQGSGLYNECASSVTNVPNDTCNMRYDSVGFDAYLPLNELFPNSEENASWNLFLVKQVDSKLVYTPLILPFSFDNRSFNGGELTLSSGLSANTLTMNTSGVLRRDYPRESASSVIGDLGSDRYFTESKAYTRVDAEETKTAIWYGVKSPHDGNRTKWAATAYWVFSGSQASIKYTPPPDTDPPTHISHEMLNYRYKNGNDYWYQPDDQAYVRLRQHDQTGNLYQYLSLLGSGLEVKSQHDFTAASNDNNHFVTNSNVVINSATREENTKYGKVKWGVIPKTHGHSYNVQYYYRDTENNVVGYNDTGMNLRVDGVAPTHSSHSLSGIAYEKGAINWVKPNSTVTVTLRQYDPHSGNDSMYVRLFGSGVDARSTHRFYEAANYNNYFITDPNVDITAASRVENTAYGKVNWSIIPKTSGHIYDVQYYYKDNVDNNSVNYQNTGEKLGVDGVAPTHNSHSLSGAAYINGSNYWVKPNTKVSISLRQYDSLSGNEVQYLRLAGSGVDSRSQHLFDQASNHNNHWMTNSNVTIDAAARVENTAYGKVNWSVTPKTHGHVYDVQYYYGDNVGNKFVDYVDTGLNLSVDGVAPAVQFRNSADTSDFINRDWDSSDIVVRLKFSDPQSGYKRSRYYWSQSTAAPSESQWSAWTTSSNYTVSKNTKGQWYLHVQTEDNVGNISTSYKGLYKFNQPPVAAFAFSPSTIYNDTVVSFANSSTDPDGDPLTYQWAYKTPGSTSWVNFSTVKNPSKVLNIKGTWAIRLTVTDDIGDNSSIVKYPNVVNRLPIPGFTFDKSIYYEGDTIKVTSSATDPDGDTLSYKYNVLTPDGNTVTFNTATFTYRVVKPGTYRITQTVTDTENASAALTKNIDVQPLIITGLVEHTLEWKRIHDDMNHPDNFFFSGERFLVSASVTNHPIEFVSVQFKGNQIDNVELNISKVLDNFHPVYKGEIYDTKMSNPTTKLSNGNVYFIFTAKWSNGTTKQDLVQVEILDDVYKAYDFYRTN